jgi:NADH dehydrogenase FAD-containing subunit
VVVVGGGYAGTNVARALDDVADVVLVEPKDAFVHNVASLRAIVDPDWLPKIFFPYDRLLARGRVVRDRAAKVTPGLVTLASGTEIPADYVVLATGSAYPFPAKSGDDDTDAAHDRYRATHKQLAAAERILLVGAGPVGIELAGEIRAAWADKQITLLDPADDVLSGRFSPELRAELRRQLTEHGVEVILGDRLAEDPPVEAGVASTFTSTTVGGREITADLWFRAHGVAPVSDYLAAGLASARRADGFLDVTPHLRVAGQDTVYALGDVSAADAKMAAFAGRQAEVVAANIRASITGGTPDREYTAGGFSAIAVPIGPAGGAGQLPGADGIAGADVVAQLKGRTLLVERFQELFQTSGEKSA